MSCCVVGSVGICPETNTNPLALIACEYGPIACGASFVEITSRMKPPQFSSLRIHAELRASDYGAPQVKVRSAFQQAELWTVEIAENFRRGHGESESPLQ